MVKWRCQYKNGVGIKGPGATDDFGNFLIYLKVQVFSVMLNKQLK